MITLTRRIKLTRMLTVTIMVPLETRNIILPLLEVGQSPNAVFVNVTKCKATAAAAALLQPFPTQSHINLLFIYCSPDWNSIPQKLVLKTYRFGQYHPYLSWAELDLGKGENGVRQPYFMFKPRLTCLCFIAVPPSTRGHSVLSFTPAYVTPSASTG